MSWLVFITFSSLFSFNGMVNAKHFIIPHMDKVVHMVFYFVLAFLGVLVSTRAYKEKGQLGKAPVYSFLFAFFYGMLMEFLQLNFTNDRHGDAWDVLANTAGALLGVLVVSTMLKKPRILKRKF